MDSVVAEREAKEATEEEKRTAYTAAQNIFNTAAKISKEKENIYNSSKTAVGIAAIVWSNAWELQKQKDKAVGDAIIALEKEMEKVILADKKYTVASKTNTAVNTAYEETVKAIKALSEAVSEEAYKAYEALVEKCAKAERDYQVALKA